MDLYDNANLQGLLRRDLHTPLYHQLRQLLREQIQRGELRDGQQLPREEDLAKRLGISRVTVRLALAELAEEGLLVRQRGRGTRVTSGRSRNPGHAGPPPLRSPLYELIDNLDTLADNTQVRLLSYQRVPPPEPVRLAFNLPADEALVSCVRVRSRHGHAFGYYSSWTRTQHPDFNAEQLARQSRIDLFRQCGLPIVRVEQKISALRVDPVPAIYLQMQPGQAVMTLERRSFDRDDQLLDLLEIQYRPDQLRYQMRLDHTPDPMESSA